MKFMYETHSPQVHLSSNPRGTLSVLLGSSLSAVLLGQGSAQGFSNRDPPGPLALHPAHPSHMQGASGQGLSLGLTGKWRNKQVDTSHRDKPTTRAQGKGSEAPWLRLAGQRRST